MFDHVEDQVKLKLQLNITQLFYLVKQEGEEIKHYYSWSERVKTEADPAKREESDEYKIVSMLH